MKGVILAAGDGTRLLPYTRQRPKVLLEVAGQAIIDFTLNAFAEVGITHLAIVVGYLGDAVRDWVGDGSRWGVRVHYLFNPDYERGNALSLYAARPFVRDEMFLLSMADHMVSPAFLWRLLEMEGVVNTVAVDFTASVCQAEEATKVLVSPEGLVTQIGKGLSHWNGIDAGVFLLTPAIFDAIAGLLKRDEVHYELSQAVCQLIGGGYPLRACDVTGCFWRDVDTPEDLEFVTDRLTGEADWQHLTKV